MRDKSCLRPAPVDLTPPGACPDPCNPDFRFRPLVSQFVAAVPAANRVYTPGAGPPMVAGDPTDDQVVKFDRPGWVVGFRAAVVTKGAYGTLEEAIAGVSVSVRMGASTQKPLVTDGNGVQYATLASLFGQDLSNAYPLLVRVREKDQWIINWFSNTANATAEATFFVLEDEAVST